MAFFSSLFPSALRPHEVLSNSLSLLHEILPGWVFVGKQAGPVSKLTSVWSKQIKTCEQEEEEASISWAPTLGQNLELTGEQGRAPELPRLLVCGRRGHTLCKWAGKGVTQCTLTRERAQALGDGLTLALGRQPQRDSPFLFFFF